MNTHLWLTRIIMAIVSVFQATTLRERYYTALNRIEILETAIDDIARISASRTEQSERHKLIIGIVTRIKRED